MNCRPTLVEFSGRLCAILRTSVLVTSEQEVSDRAANAESAPPSVEIIHGNRTARCTQLFARPQERQGVFSFTGK